ncbi:MAG: rhamnan synthesis F family protein [Actinomycetota bacterium]
MPSWLATSQWFDGPWYLAANADVAAAGVAPAEHYWRFGMAEGRSPGPRFDAFRYEVMNPSARGRALVHHRELGRAAGAEPEPGTVVQAAHPELECGFFDTDWYVRRHPESADESHPYVHFARQARTSPNPAGPFFDTAEYLVRHPVARTWATPLAHFLAHPEASAPVASDGGANRPLLRPETGRTSDSPEMQVCVMIHAYYPDLLPQLLHEVRSLAASATFRVSVCEAAHVALAEQAVDRELGVQARRVVRHVPNRGRNFAPLLVGFADEVRAHRLVLHLHTKKSLYSRRERADWRTHLLQCLSGPAVPAVLDLFASHPQVGVVQPSPFVEMPVWACHWLGNAGNGRRLLQRCGLDPERADGFVDYPVGGMFWARVQALRPLLDAGLTVEDFDAEAGQTDGTLAHAVERSVCISAASQGLGFVELDHETGQWRDGWSSRNADRFGEQDIELLRAQVHEVDLVSVDVFDTLLLRPTLAPTSLQYFAARAVVDDAGEAERWVAERINAEHRARVNRPELADVGLAEVFDELEPAMQAMQREEVAIEPRAVKPRGWLLDVLREGKAKGKRLVVMTDTTLPADVVKALVSQAGVGDLFDEWYVSNERRARKDQGGMWSLVRDSEAVPVQCWLHIGDNERSDIQQALTHEVAWSYVPSPRAVAQFHAPDGLLERGNWATLSALGLSAAALYDSRPRPADEEVFGYAVLGPLVMAFVSRLVQHHQQHPDQRLMLLARDSWLFEEVLRSLRAEHPGVLPPTTWFEVSRRAALAASSAVGVDVDMVLDAGAFDGAFADLVEQRLGVRPIDGRFDVRVSHPGDRLRCAELLQACAPEIEAHGRGQLTGLRHHLERLGVSETEPLCLVDLGYSATTQRALGRVLPNGLAGLYCATTPAGAGAGGVGVFADGVPFWSGNWFLDHSLLLEALLSSTEGAVTGYSPSDGTVRRASPSADIEAGRVSAVQRAARRYCLDLVRIFGPAVVTDPIDPATVLGWVGRIPQQFLLPPNRLFAGMRIENGFVGRQVDDAVG